MWTLSCMDDVTSIYTILTSDFCYTCTFEHNPRPISFFQNLVLLALPPDHPTKDFGLKLKNVFVFSKL